MRASRRRCSWLVVPHGERGDFAVNELVTMFVAVRSVGPNDLYASLALAQRWDESSSEREDEKAPPQRLTLR